MKMTVLERDDDISHVVLFGRLDATAEEEIGEGFSQAVGAQDRPAIIDMSGLDFLASLGIRLIFVNSKRLMKSGHKMVVLKPQALVESVLRTAKLDALIPIAHDLDEALGIARGEAHPAADRRSPADAVAGRVESGAGSTLRSVSDGALKLSIENRISEFETLNAALADFLESHGAPRRAAYAVNLAIEELVVNVMHYAYVDDEVHRIDIEVAIHGDQIIVRIVDDGRPFDPRTGPTLDLHAEDREVGGLGLLLVLDMVEALSYRRVDEMNHVEVRVQILAEDDRGEMSTASRASPDDSGEA